LADVLADAGRVFLGVCEDQTCRKRFAYSGLRIPGQLAIPVDFLIQGDLLSHRQLLAAAFFCAQTEPTAVIRTPLTHPAVRAGMFFCGRGFHF
jgi:hypothetical protein